MRGSLSVPVSGSVPVSLSLSLDGGEWVGRWVGLVVPVCVCMCPRMRVSICVYVSHKVSKSWCAAMVKLGRKPLFTESHIDLNLN